MKFIECVTRITSFSSAQMLFLFDVLQCFTKMTEVETITEETGKKKSTKIHTLYRQHRDESERHIKATQFIIF